MQFEQETLPNDSWRGFCLSGRGYKMGARCLKHCKTGTGLEEGTDEASIGSVSQQGSAPSHTYPLCQKQHIRLSREILDSHGTRPPLECCAVVRAVSLSC